MKLRDIQPGERYNVDSPFYRTVMVLYTETLVTRYGAWIAPTRFDIARTRIPLATRSSLTGVLCLDEHVENSTPSVPIDEIARYATQGDIDGITRLVEPYGHLVVFHPRLLSPRRTKEL